jgi:hypothetical protein
MMDWLFPETSCHALCQRVLNNSIRTATPGSEKQLIPLQLLPSAIVDQYWADLGISIPAASQAAITVLPLGMLTG